METASVTAVLFVKDLKRVRTYTVADRSDDSVVLELDAPVRCGRFVKLGPIRPSGDMFEGYMEFAVYEDKEKALPRSELVRVLKGVNKEDTARGVCTQDEI